MKETLNPALKHAPEWVLIDDGRAECYIAGFRGLNGEAENAREREAWELGRRQAERNRILAGMQKSWEQHCAKVAIYRAAQGAK